MVGHASRAGTRVGADELRETEHLLLTHNLYASDALHAATFITSKEKEAISRLLRDDRHYLRLKEISTGNT